MAVREPSLIDRLIEGYEIAKKPLAYIVMLVAILLQSLPADLLPPNTRGLTYTVVLIVLALILLQVLFEIYEKVTAEEKSLNLIDSNEVYKSILAIVSSERSVNIKYLGVAGRHGWHGVLEKLLNENNEDSLIANRTRFEIDVALLNPEVQNAHDELFKRFDTVGSVATSVQAAARHLSEIAEPGSQLRLYYYDHMPNMLGFLVNDNYLYVTYAYWEHFQGELVLRAGGSDYFVYDKNDEFGGREVIRRFLGWFEFIVESRHRSDADSTQDDTEDKT